MKSCDNNKIKNVLKFILSSNSYKLLPEFTIMSKPKILVVIFYLNQLSNYEDTACVRYLRCIHHPRNFLNGLTKTQLSAQILEENHPSHLGYPDLVLESGIPAKSLLSVTLQNTAKWR